MNCVTVARNGRITVLVLLDRRFSVMFVCAKCSKFKISISPAVKHQYGGVCGGGGTIAVNVTMSFTCKNMLPSC
jgi:hypothetical protein